MKISELIAKLQKLLEENGDLEIWTQNNDSSEILLEKFNSKFTIEHDEENLDVYLLIK